MTLFSSYQNPRSDDEIVKDEEEQVSLLSTEGYGSVPNTVVVLLKDDESFHDENNTEQSLEKRTLHHKRWLWIGLAMVVYFGVVLAISTNRTTNVLGSSQEVSGIELLGKTKKVSAKSTKMEAKKVVSVKSTKMDAKETEKEKKEQAKAAAKKAKEAEKQKEQEAKAAAKEAKAAEKQKEQEAKAAAKEAKAAEKKKEQEAKEAAKLAAEKAEGPVPYPGCLEVEVMYGKKEREKRVCSLLLYSNIFPDPCIPYCLYCDLVSFLLI